MADEFAATTITSTDYPVHITCASCRHLHRHKNFKIFHNPERHARFHCERCDKPLFGIGRSSTQVTFASAESQPTNRLHLVRPLQQVCTNRLRKKGPSPLQASVLPASPDAKDVNRAEAGATTRKSSKPDAVLSEEQGELGKDQNNEIVGKTHRKSQKRRRWSWLWNMFLNPQLAKKRWQEHRERTPKSQRTFHHNGSTSGNIQAKSFDKEPAPKGSSSEARRGNEEECLPAYSPSKSIASLPGLDSPKSSGTPHDQSIGSTDFGHHQQDIPREDHPKAQEVGLARRQRTLVYKKLIGIECRCGSACQCKCTIYPCQDGLQRAGGSDLSFLSNSEDRRSPAATDDVPTYILDGLSFTYGTDSDSSGNSRGLELRRRNFFLDNVGEHFSRPR